jgi:hypothetical protein
MRLCSHVIKHDTGLAPNPFHGHRTSALCTPSHVNARLEVGDWLVGNSPRKDGNRLVYAMCISEVLSMNRYFHDAGFENKKPKPDGTAIERCGDKMYFQCGANQWKRLPSPFHNGPGDFTKDLGVSPAGHPVFVSNQFYYFGSERVAVPIELEPVIRDRQGIRYVRDRSAEDFVDWLSTNFDLGILGKPRDMESRSGEMGTASTDWIVDGSRKVKNKKQTDCRPNAGSSSSNLHRKGCR